jgi:membrane protein insertase Oxa1/YidC/SpoIIIJ
MVSLPGALALYYTTSNLIAVAQQHYLLKKDVGELALQAIKQGNISEQSLISLPSATINKYKGPEINRVNMRKKQVDLLRVRLKIDLIN